MRAPVACRDRASNVLSWGGRETGHMRLRSEFEVGRLDNGHQVATDCVAEAGGISGSVSLV
jgi:hypothetical protein